MDSDFTNESIDFTNASPIKNYEVLSQVHSDNTNSFFSDFVEKSNIDIEANHETIAKYNQEKAVHDDIASRLKMNKIGRILLIVMIVVGAVLLGVGIYLIANAASNDGSVAAAVIVPILGVAMLVLGIVFLVIKINPRIKKLSEELYEQKKLLDEISDEAWKQVTPLISLMSDWDTFTLLEKTMPSFKIEPYFSIETYRSLNENFDFNIQWGGTSSVTDTLSGNFEGNPFVFADFLDHFMGVKSYTGSLTIHWTTTSYDSDGNRHDTNHTQTLTATVEKPYPEYRTRKHLYYGNQEAPNLSFSRNAKHSEQLSDKKLDKKVASGEKKLNKLSEKAVRRGEDFQAIGNPEFEVLFDATNRNDEVQFRYLFTPVAQRNMVDVLTSGVGYGDDFTFEKAGKLNAITAEHAQVWKLRSPAAAYYSMDYEMIKRAFYGINMSYFKNFYFNFAPLFAIPAYTDKYNAEDGGPVQFSSNFTAFEHEAIANAMFDGNARNRLAPERLDTRCILKAALTEKRNDGDLLNVGAFGYYGEKRIDLVPMNGGDGNIHNVPVEWIEYIPTNKVSAVFVCQKDTDVSGIAADGNATVCHGLKGVVI